MPVPDDQTLMLPALKALSGGREIRLSEIRRRVATAERLTAEDLQELLPSGQQAVFSNRIAWAVSYVTRAGLVERVRRGVYQVSTQGAQLLDQAPARIDIKLLDGYPAFAKWRSQRRTNQPPAEPPPGEDQGEPVKTPEEALEGFTRQLREALETEVLDRLRQADPKFLERVVVDLLIAMGYGGGDATMGQVIGRSGDGGIDGTIREDALGLDEVYLQAKKYSEGNTVGAGALRNFAGAIDAAGTNKGVFVTTTSFTAAAREYVRLSPKRIILIDGAELARLMVAHGVGVRTRIRYEVKRIDEDYFEQEAF
ncbi:MAG: restriction endonuclease [Acidobacteriota bacterium]|nr:restriction endonuclease [Acidobacteriota bacterium]